MYWHVDLRVPNLVCTQQISQQPLLPGHLETDPALTRGQSLQRLPDVHLLGVLPGPRVIPGLPEALPDGVLQHDVLLVPAAAPGVHPVGHGVLSPGPRPQLLVCPGRREHSVIYGHAAPPAVLAEAGHTLHGDVKGLDVGERDPRVDHMEEGNF